MIERSQERGYDPLSFYKANPDDFEIVKLHYGCLQYVKGVPFSEISSLNHDNLFNCHNYVSEKISYIQDLRDSLLEDSQQHIGSTGFIEQLADLVIMGPDLSEIPQEFLSNSLSSVLDTNMYLFMYIESILNLIIEKET